MCLRCFAGCFAILIAGCSQLLGVQDPVPGDGKLPIDAPDRDGNNLGDSFDGPKDGPIAAGSPLLLSEVVLAPSPGEFIEIVNTSNQTFDLTNFFVSDNGNYFRLPVGVPTVDGGDFIAQFPAGTSIPPHGVVTVAIPTAAEFTASYGIAPTFSVADATLTVVTANGIPGLTSGGEVIVLFFWDGNSDLVSDADIMLAGSPSAANSIVNKSGIVQEGIDADTTSSAYAVDAKTITIQMGTPGSALSTKRIALEAGNETQAGVGNGLAGEDETSEDTRTTWDSVVFTAPDPGTVPVALLQ